MPKRQQGGAGKPLARRCVIRTHHNSVNAREHRSLVQGLQNACSVGVNFEAFVLCGGDINDGRLMSAYGCTVLVGEG